MLFILQNLSNAFRTPFGHHQKTVAEKVAERLPKMLKKNVDVSLISEVTGLSNQQIAKFM